MRLDGALHVPEENGAPRGGIDAVICLHGVGSNFYGSSLFEAITPSLLELGAAVLWANTRGRDGFHTANTTSSRKRQGAAYEIVDECRHDIAAWIDHLNRRGLARIALVGHSLGAIKAIYSQARQPHQAVQCVVAMSPPRLAYSRFVNGANHENFSAAMAAAERHVAQGDGDALVEVRFPFPLVISAGTFVNKYGREEHYNILKFAGRVACPLLFTYGSIELEQNEAFTGLPDELQTLPTSGPLEVITIAGANHIYTGCYQPLAAELTAWLEGR